MATSIPTPPLRSVRFRSVRRTLSKRPYWEGGVRGEALQELRCGGGRNVRAPLGALHFQEFLERPSSQAADINQRLFGRHKRAEKERSVGRARFSSFAAFF
ncbi:hypothetical protein MRX96_008956 [Rhipicephalus microplus]